MDKSKKKNKREKEKSQKKRGSNKRNEADQALDKKKSSSSSSFKKLFNKFTKKKKKTEESEYATLGAVGGHLTRKHVIPQDIPVNYNPQVSQPENESVYAPLSTCESDRSFAVGFHDSTHRSSVESLTSWHVNMNNSDVYQRLPSPTTKPTVVHYHLNIQNCDGLQIHMENSKPSCRIRKDLQRAGSNPGTDVQEVSWIMTPGSSQQADLDTTNTSEFFNRNSVSQHNVASAVSERTLTPQSPGCGPATTQKSVIGVNNDCAYVKPVSQSSLKGQGQEVIKVQGQEVIKVQGQEACQSSCGVSRSYNDDDLASVPCLPVQSKVSVSRSLSVSNVKTMKNAGFTKANVSTSQPLLNQVGGMQPVVGVALANPVLSEDVLHEKKSSKDIGSVTGSVAPNDIKTSVEASHASENNESIFSGNMNCESSNRQANRRSVISKDVSLGSRINSVTSPCNSDIPSDTQKVGVNHTNYKTQIIQNPAESCNVSHDGVVKYSDAVNKSHTRRRQRSSAQNSGLMLDHANTATQTSLPRPKNASDISDSSTQTTLPRKGSSVGNADSSTQTTLPRKEQTLVVAASNIQTEPQTNPTACASVGQVKPMSPSSIPSLPVATATTSSLSIPARTAQTASVTMPTNSTKGPAVISTTAAVPAVIPTAATVSGDMSAAVVTLSSGGAVAVLQSVLAQSTAVTAVTTSPAGRVPVTLPMSPSATAKGSVTMTRVTSGASARVPVALTTVPSCASARVPVAMTTVPSGASARIHVAMTTVPSGVSARISGAMTTVPSGTSVGVSVSMPTVPTGAVAMTTPAMPTMLSSSVARVNTGYSAPNFPGSGPSRVPTAVTSSVSSTSEKPVARVTPNIQLPSTTDSDDTDEEIDELLNQAQQNQDMLAMETERVHAHLHALRSQREAQSTSQGHTRSRSLRGQGRQQPQQESGVRSALRALHEAQGGASNNDTQVVSRSTVSPSSEQNRTSLSPSQTDESALQQRISRLRHSNRRIHQQTPNNRPAPSTPNSYSSSHQHPASSSQDSNPNGSNRSTAVSVSRAGSSRTSSQGVPPSHQEVDHTNPVLQVSNNNLSPRHNARLTQHQSRQAERTQDTSAENIDTPGSLSPVTRGRQTRRQRRELLAQAGPFQRSFSGRNAELARAGGQHLVRPRSGSVPRREDLQTPSQGQRRPNESVYEKLARIRPQLIRVPGVLLVDIQAGRIVVTVSPDRSNVADITLFMTQNDIPMNEYICGVLARQYRNSRPAPPVVTVP